MDGQAPKSEPAQVGPQRPPVKIVHRLSKRFETVPADGGWGMFNGHGKIQLNFFTERPMLPDFVVFPLRPEDPQAMEEHYEQGFEKDHIMVVRDFHVAVTMSVDAAKHVHTVLGNFIALAEDQMRAAGKGP